ncbi:MAG: YncE family protein [Balneolales bacterium]
MNTNQTIKLINSIKSNTLMKPQPITQPVFMLCTLALMLFMTGLTACSDLLSDNNKEQTIARLLVINEGNWSEGDGSITAFDPESGETVQQHFEKVNGRPLAGMIQSVTVSKGRLFIVANNANKIEVADAETLESIATIETGSDFTPAGFALTDDGGKGYVSHLYDNAVFVVDMESYQITENRIPAGRNPQEMMIYNSRLYVLNNGFGEDHTITVIHTETDEVMEELEVGAGPAALHRDNEDRIWVVSSGFKAYDEDWNRDPDNDHHGRIDVLSASGSGHIATIETGGFPRALALDESSARAWIVNEGAVQQIDMNTYGLLDDSLISRDFNGIGYSEVDGLFYLAHSRGFSQSGQAVIYDPEGTAVDSFATGIAPRDFVFQIE